MKYSNGVFYEDANYIKHNRHLTLKECVKFYAKKIAYPFVNIFQKAIITMCYYLYKNNDFKNNKYPVAIVAIFKNECRFLREWIEYYRVIGVDHFFLYNNNSSDNYLKLLKPYIDLNLVSLVDWPFVPGQLSAYKHWWENHRKECGYAAFIDIDEFICPVYDYNIKEWLQKHAKYPVIKIDWVMFGTSGILKHDDSKLVIEQYTSCWNKRLTIGKVIFNCSYEAAKLDKMTNHLLTIKIGPFAIYPFNDTGNMCWWEYHEKCSSPRHTIQLNHYYSRAFDILEQKINRGSAAHNNNWKAKVDYIARENMNKSKDYTIQRFLLQLKNNFKDEI